MTYELFVHVFVQVFSAAEKIGKLSSLVNGEVLHVILILFVIKILIWALMN